MKHLISLAIIAVICSTTFTHAMNNDNNNFSNDKDLRSYTKWLTLLQDQFITEKPFCKVRPPIQSLIQFIINKTSSPAHQALWNQWYPSTLATAKVQKEGLKYVFHSMLKNIDTDPVDQKAVSENLLAIYTELKHLETYHCEINNRVFIETSSTPHIVPAPNSTLLLNHQ